MRRSVERAGDGGVTVTLEEGERELLASLAEQLRPLARGESLDPALVGRLYPPASADPETDAAYRALVGDSLVQERLDALDVVSETLAGGREVRSGWQVDLDAEAAHAWLTVVNDARLVLATVVGITSEEDWEAGPDPQDPSSVALWYLGWLEEELLAALTGTTNETTDPWD
jgi:hypothetical protein